ncbi:MAG: acyltransferase, partial [Desulfocapsaceae bacterium]|nr:acyltransferase [Desulfocapsaceae bacterium]
MKYRADIDGLRTLAILPVVFFHAGLPLFSGGYVGVDIFFVISGFLIGGIIIDARHEGTFSYIQFYERRARRLLPALFTVVSATLIAGYVLLIPGDYRELFESARYTVVFISNFFFMNTIDYFSQESEFMPLLHTWSLAIEEQFYIFWPLVIALYVKMTDTVSKRFGIAFLLSILIISLISSVISIRTDPVMTFYMIPFRLWELALGTVIAIAMRTWPDLVKGERVWLFPPWLPYSAGLILCIVSVFTLDKQSLFPALNAVPVCIGTALLLLFGDSKANPAAWVFRRPPVVFIGKVSYSWYLWHWVVLAFFRVYQEKIVLSGNHAFLCIVLSLLLAIITWYLIENPMRFKASKSLIFRFSAVAGLLLLGISSAGISADGAAFRFKIDLDYISSRGEMWRWASTRKIVDGLG